ncbi:MAG: Uma2 family endonuclease, partial [Gemmataceae bacterium]
CTAPDVYVAFGRPPGHRGSYKVWEEGDIFPQVVFEVWSPGNTRQEMANKRAFYRRYGAEEYYLIDPDTNEVEAWVRDGRRLVEVDDVTALVSPRLGIRFRRVNDELHILGPDGERFLTFAELGEQLDVARHQLSEEHRRAEAERKRAEAEKKRAEAEKKRADEEAAAKAKLAAKLRELGVDPEAV